MGPIGTDGLSTNLVSEMLVKSIIVHMPVNSCIYSLWGYKGQSSPEVRNWSIIQQRCTFPSSSRDFSLTVVRNSTIITTSFPTQQKGESWPFRFPTVQHMYNYLASFPGHFTHGLGTRLM